ncbi:MAG TPA: PPC domain-containing protein [Longimicrobiaceae bacterium]|jgi:hypothetical protein|nr:PPC domain-containing protein [Longimicrobiaceae bacterium]
MTSMRRVSAGLAALALCASAPAAAQPGRPAAAPMLREGQTVTGALSDSDPTLNLHGRFKVYRLAGRRGQRFSIIMRSTAFDSYLSLGRQVAGLTDYLKTDDDGGGNSDARLRYTLPETGTYFVVAQSLKPEGLGSFTVAVDTLPTPVNTPPVPVRLGQTVSGRLEETDPTLDADGTHYDLYTFEGRKGQRLEIAMQAADFDAYLGFGRMEGGDVHVTESDDDSGGGTNARLRATLPEDGRYVIRANAIGENSTGAYTLQVSERAPAPQPVASNLAVGQTVSGTLADTDPAAEDDSYYDLYRFTGHAGEKITITMTSDAFDSFVVLGRMENGEFKQIDTDDDGAGGNNSKLERTLDADGEYLIRANSIAAHSTGAYTIKLESSRSQ